jgi:hypothetical protein
LFRPVVKKVLAERTVYVPPERDRDDVNHIEDFLATDLFGPEVRLRRSWLAFSVNGAGYSCAAHEAIRGANAGSAAVSVSGRPIAAVVSVANEAL